MQWNKEFAGKVKQSYDTLLAFAFLLSFLGLILGKPLLFLIVGIIAAFVGLSAIYDYFIGKTLKFVNDKKVYRMFPDDEVKVEYILQNGSKFPIVNGHFEFSLGDEVEGDSFHYMNKKMERHYKIPLSILNNSEVNVPITFKAKKRGTTKPTGIQYHFPHLINFNMVFLSFKTYSKTEFIIYPKPLPVRGLEERYHVTIGSQRTSFSPFEDRLSPMGTRDYVSSDSFDRIHWKASAKKQSLQTKVFERTHDITWVFVVNISKSTTLGNSYISDNLENILSYVAYLCQFATKNGYPYEIHINARTAGSAPYFHLVEGEGKDHLRNALDLLARVKQDEIIYPLENMLYRVDQELYKPKTIFTVGEVSQDVMYYNHKWEKSKMSVFHVHDQNGSAYIGNVVREVAQ